MSDLADQINKFKAKDPSCLVRNITEKKLNMNFPEVSTVNQPKQAKNCEIGQNEVKRASNKLKRDQSIAQNRQRNYSK